MSTDGAGSGSAAAGEYWVEQMQAGLEFVERVLAHPVEECGEPLVEIAERARGEGVELLFATEPHAAARPRLFLARSRVADRLLAVAAALEASGHKLLIEDCFRTREMQRDLAMTDAVLEKLASVIGSAEPDASQETIFARLAVVVAACPKGAGHMAGAAVDVSVIDSDGRELQRGGPYVTVSEAMPMDSPFVSSEAGENRRFITAVMEEHGFHAFPFEFWHYSVDDAFARVAADDRSPALYGPVERRPDGSVVPVADQLKPLCDPQELAARMAQITTPQRGVAK